MQYLLRSNQTFRSAAEMHRTLYIGIEVYTDASLHILENAFRLEKLTPKELTDTRYISSLAVST